MSKWDQYIAEEPTSKWDQYAVDEGPSGMEAFGHGAGQGVTLGFADEGKAAVGAGLDWLTGADEDFSENYESLRDAYRQEDADIQEAHPVAYGAGNVAGILPTAIASAPAGAIKGGIALGAAVGAGEAEEMEDIPEEMAKGAGYGLAGGAAGKVVGQVVGRGMRTVGKGMKEGAEGISKEHGDQLSKIMIKTKSKLQKEIKKLKGAARRNLQMTDDQIDNLDWDESRTIFSKIHGQEKADALWKQAKKEVIKDIPLLGEKSIGIGDIALAGPAIAAGGPMGAVAPLAGRAVKGMIKRQGAKKITDYKGSVVTEDLVGFLNKNGTRFKKWGKQLKKANARGPASLSSTVYMLQQQDPEFRKAFRDEEE